ncbi:MAG: MarR family transcriptional regulator [Sphingobium sp.]
MKDPLALLPGYLLRRASTAVLAELNQRLAGIEINHADASLLILIGHNPGLTQSDAGRMLGIQRANMVPLIARNEARGWLIRQQVDGRSQGLSLSPEGEAMRHSARAVIDRFEEHLIEGVPQDLRPHVVPILGYLWGARPGQSRRRSRP